MAPQRRPDRTHAGAPGALLPPQLLAGTRYQLAVFGCVRAGPLRGAVMLHRLPQQIFIHAAENLFSQLQRANLLAVQIEYVNLCHRKSAFSP